MTNFLNHSIQFLSTDHGVSAAGEKLNSIGNFFLSPIRYLFRGRTMRVMARNPETRAADFTDISDQDVGERSFLKTAKAVLLFVPGVVLGSCFKKIALIVSPTLQGYYKLMSDSITQRKVSQAANDRFKSGASPSALTVSTTPQVEPRPLFTRIPVSKTIVEQDLLQGRDEKTGALEELADLCDFTEISGHNDVSQERWEKLGNSVQRGGPFLEGAIPDDMQEMTSAERNARFLTLMVLRPPSHDMNEDTLFVAMRHMLQKLDVGHRLALLDYIGRSCPVDFLSCLTEDDSRLSDPQRCIKNRFRLMIDDTADALEKKKVLPEQLVAPGSEENVLVDQLLTRLPDTDGLPRLSSFQQMANDEIRYAFSKVTDDQKLPFLVKMAVAALMEGGKKFADHLGPRERLLNLAMDLYGSHQQVNVRTTNHADIVKKAEEVCHELSDLAKNSHLIGGLDQPTIGQFEQSVRDCFMVWVMSEQSRAHVGWRIVLPIANILDFESRTHRP